MHKKSHFKFDLFFVLLFFFSVEGLGFRIHDLA